MQGYAAIYPCTSLCGYCGCKAAASSLTLPTLLNPNYVKPNYVTEHTLNFVNVQPCERELMGQCPNKGPSRPRLLLCGYCSQFVGGPSRFYDSSPVCARKPGLSLGHVCPMVGALRCIPWLPLGLISEPL